MIGINGEFELEFLIGCSDWHFPEGGFFSFRLAVDDGPIYTVFASTAEPSSMFVFLPQSMEFFESLKSGTYLNFSDIQDEDHDDVLLNCTGVEDFSIRLRKTSEALCALYELAQASVAPEIAERSFHSNDPLDEQEEIEGMTRMLTGISELTREEPKPATDRETDKSEDTGSKEESGIATDDLRLLNPLLQMSINNKATDLNDFVIDVDELDRADEERRELTWTVGDVKGVGIQFPTGSRTVDALFSEFMEECRQRGGEELASRDMPGREFAFGALSETRVVLGSTPDREFTAVCSLIPAGLVMFRITHTSDGHSDAAVNADVRLVQTIQAVMEAFRAD